MLRAARTTRSRKPGGGFAAGSRAVTAPAPAAAGPPHRGRHAADARKSFLMVDHGGVHARGRHSRSWRHSRGVQQPGSAPSVLKFGGVEDASGSGAGGRFTVCRVRHIGVAVRRSCYRSPGACPHVGSAAKPWREIARPRCAPAPARPAAAPARAATAARCARCVPRCSNGGSPVAPHPGRRVVRRADTPTSSPTRKRPPARSTPGRRRRRRAPPGPRTRRRAPPGPCRQQAEGPVDASGGAGCRRRLRVSRPI